MEEYKVTITETLKKTVTVEAESRNEAHQKVSDQWDNSEYILDADDFIGVEFEVENIVPKVKCNKLVSECESYAKPRQDREAR